MRKISIIILLVLMIFNYSRAATYEWTDDKGVVNFSDDPDRVPKEYRKVMKERESIRGYVKNTSITVEETKAEVSVAPRKPLQAFGEHGQQWWKNSFASLRKEIEDIQLSIYEKNGRLSTLKRKMTIYHRSSDRNSYNALNDEIASAASLQSELKTQLAALEAEANRSGVPNDWR